MTNNSRAAHVFLALSALLVILAIACSDSNPTSPGSTPAVNTSSATSPGTGAPGSVSTGTLRVMLKDNPAEASAVLVTFSDVSVHRSGGGWTTSLSRGVSPEDLPVTCDLIKLGKEFTEGKGGELLGVGQITAGHYTQIRLVIIPESVAMYRGGTPSGSKACVVGTAEQAPTLVPIGFTGALSPVTVPSGEIKLNHEFDLSAGTTMTITLDFDAEKSIHQTGNDTYVMKPVVSVFSEQVSNQ